MTVTILRNASVLNAADGSLAEGQSVVVEGSRIADVGPGLTGPDDRVLTTPDRTLKLIMKAGRLYKNEL